MGKIKIEPYPPSNGNDYGHLTPIVDYLLHQGNKLSHEFMWGVDRTGYYCHLSGNKGFNEIENVFDIPKSIEIDKENKSIFCSNTYTTILLR